MSKTYTVVIEETISETFSVQAESEEEAYREAVARYNDGRFVLSPGNVEQKQLAVIYEDREPKWVAF